MLKSWIKERYFLAVDEEDRQLTQPDVSLKDLLTYVLIMVLYLTDIGSDIYVGWDLIANNRVWPGVLVLTFVVIPSLVVNYMAQDFWADRKWVHKRNAMYLINKVAFWLQFGPHIMYVKAIYFGCRSRWWSSNKEEKEENYNGMLEIENKLTVLRLIEATIKSTLQVLIQGYLVGSAIWKYHDDGGDANSVCLQFLSIAISLVSIAFSPTAYTRIRSKSEKKNLSYFASFLQFLGILLIITSRCLAIVLVIMIIHGWVAIVLVIHLLLGGTLIYISLGENNENSLRDAKIFLMLSPITFFIWMYGLSRRVFVPVYAIEFTENVVMLMLCSKMSFFTFPFTLHVMIASFIMFLIGMFISFSVLQYFPTDDSSKKEHLGEEGNDNGATATSPLSITALPTEKKSLQDDGRDNITTGSIETAP